MAKHTGPIYLFDSVRKVYQAALLRWRPLNRKGAVSGRQHFLYSGPLSTGMADYTSMIFRNALAYIDGIQHDQQGIDGRLQWSAGNGNPPGNWGEDGETFSDDIVGSTHDRIVLEVRGQKMARKVRLFVHRNNRAPTHRPRHHCQYGREACGNGVFRCTVTIRPLQQANGYDFAQDIHYVTEKHPMVMGEGVKECTRQQGSLVESISSTYMIEPNRIK